MAFEYLAAHLLLSFKLERFIRELEHMKPFYGSEIPSVFEQAILLYQTSKPGARVDLAGRHIRQATLDRYQRFQKQFAKTRLIHSVERCAGTRVRRHTLVLLHLLAKPRLDTTSMILRISIFSRFVILALIAGWLHPSLLAAAPEVSAASAPKQVRTPRLSPDYTDLVIPPNIAPLNFIVQEAGTQFDVELRGAAGRLVQVKSGTPSIQFPLKQWRELLDQNVGQNVQLTVSVRIPRAHGSALRP
jgi:hypothetical protein